MGARDSYFASAANLIPDKGNTSDSMNDGNGTNAAENNNTNGLSASGIGLDTIGAEIDVRIPPLSSRYCYHRLCANIKNRLS